MRNTFFTSLSKETVVAILLSFIALIFFSLFFFPTATYKTIQKKEPSTHVISPTITYTPSPTKKITKRVVEPTEEEISQEPQTVQITIVITPTPYAQTNSDKVTIHVSVTGSNQFDVSLGKGKDQCDVLNEAKNTNKISQLLMKYDSSLDSYGVYQINNVGKDNTVWWTYEVNGKSPSQGCNHVAANDGDIVSWKYIGQ